MNLTKLKLKRIIKEEINNILLERRTRKAQAACEKASDGCTSSPNGTIVRKKVNGKTKTTEVDWRPCCVEHDCCYDDGTPFPRGHPKAKAARLKCDESLRDCINKIFPTVLRTTKDKEGKKILFRQGDLYFHFVQLYAEKYFSHDVGKKPSQTK